MHEWALAESIITAVLQHAEQHHLKTITQVTIRLGTLQQIETDIFKFALTEIKKQNEKTKDVRIRLEKEDTQLQCTSCQHRWGFSDMKKTLNGEEGEAIHFIPEVAYVHTRCPNCGSPDFTIGKGRGVTLQSIKGIREDE